MATPAQIANDLDAQAERLKHSHDKILATSLMRGAQCIRELLAENQVLAENTTVTAIVTMPEREA
ncbi:MAG: hypothetical protein OQK05_00185 [Pseudopelagicola sp.]|nr:hypothetical protein [Pseudopelagicola sp.]